MIFPTCEVSNIEEYHRQFCVEVDTTPLANTLPGKAHHAAELTLMKIGSQDKHSTSRS